MFQESGIDIQSVVTQSLSTPVLGMPVEKVNTAVQTKDFSTREWEVPRQEAAKALADKGNRPVELGAKPDQVATAYPLLSKVETATALAVVRSHATAELAKIEKVTKTKLESESEAWRKDSQISIDAKKVDIEGIISRLTNDADLLTQQQTEINKELARLESEAGQSAEASVASVQRTYNHQQVIEALKQEIVQVKKECSTGVEKMFAAVKSPQPTIVEENEIKIVDKALIQDPNRLKSVLVQELGNLSKYPESSKAYVDNVYILAKSQLAQYEQDPVLVDYVRNHIAELVDPDFDATFVLKGENWRVSRYTHLQEELITWGIAAIILRTDRTLPDTIKPIIEGLREQILESSTATIKEKRMQTGDYAAKKNEKDEIDIKKRDIQRNLRDAGLTNQKLLQDEEHLNEEAKVQVERGMELLYAQLYPESEKFLHRPDKSYITMYADKLARSYLSSELLAKSGTDSAGIDNRLQALREQIARAVLPADADKLLINQMVEFLKPTYQKYINQETWVNNQFDVVDRILKGDRVAVCQAGDVPALVATIDTLMDGSTTKEFDLILAENPANGDTWISKRIRRPIRINATQGEFDVISIPRGTTGEYFHFILSKQEKKLLRVEISDTLDGAREIRQDDKEYPNDRVFWAFLNDTSAKKGDGVAHTMFFLSKEQKK